MRPPRASGRCRTRSGCRGPAAACPDHASVARYAAATRTAPTATLNRDRLLPDRAIASSKTPSAMPRPKRQTQSRPNSVLLNTTRIVSSAIACDIGLPLMRAASAASQIAPETTLVASVHAPHTRASGRTLRLASASGATSAAPNRCRHSEREHELAKHKQRRCEVGKSRCDDYRVHRGKRAVG